MSGKVLETIIQISGEVSPTLSKSIGNVQGLLGGINMSMVGIAAAAGAAALAVGKFALDGLEQAKQFNKELSNVGTLLDGDVKGRLSELTPEILKISNATGVMTSDLNDGMYQVISAFGDSADAAKQLEISAKAAKAGNATTTDSINLLSAVTKGYGDTSAEAMQKAADLSFMTVKLGQTDFPALAQNMGKVIPLANTMGVVQEELFGAVATLTGVTGNTSEVMTQLRGTMQGFLQPTEAMTNAIHSLGYANGKTLLESEGLQGALELLTKSVKGDKLALAGLFGSVEAKSAVLALAGTQAENFTNKTKEMFKASGAAQKAFEEQTNNSASYIKKIQTLFTNSKTNLGLKLEPLQFAALKAAMPIVEGLVVGFDKILETAAQVAAMFSPMFKDLGNLIAPISKSMGKELLPLLDMLKGLVLSIGSVIAGIVKLLMPLIELVIGFVGTILVGAFKVLVPLVVDLGYAVADVFNFIGHFLSDDLPAMIDGLAHLFENQFFVDIFKGLFNTAATIINAFINGINAIKIDIPKWVPNIGGQRFSASIPQIPYLATGGFTQGPSIAGEAGMEAVISFDPAYRSENLAIWSRAGELLGSDVLETQNNNSSVVYDFGGVEFSPQIIVKGDSDVSEIIKKIKEEEAEFFDYLEYWIKHREDEVFA